MKKTDTKKAVPIVPYLRLPQREGEEAYLIGSRCKTCGETYLGKRVICIVCYAADEMTEIALSRTGELFTYTVIYQSAPWVQTPYIAGVVKLPEGPFVRASITGCEAQPDAVWVGMPLEMVTEKVRQDSEGNDIIAYSFRRVTT